MQNSFKSFILVDNVDSRPANLLGKCIELGCYCFITQFQGRSQEAEGFQLLELRFGENKEGGLLCLEHSLLRI